MSSSIAVSVPGSAPLASVMPPPKSIAGHTGSYFIVNKYLWAERLNEVLPMAGVWQTGATWARSWARSTPCADMFARRRDPRRRAGKAPRQPDGPVIRPTTGRASPGDRNAHSTSSTGRGASDRRLPSVRKSPSAAVTTWVELLPEREAKARTLARISEGSG
jgi:hypothetical protein